MLAPPTTREGSQSKGDATPRRKSNCPRCVSALERACDTARFDDHFDVRSAYVEDALEGKGKSNDCTKRVSPLPAFRQLSKADCWGIQCSQVQKLWELLKEDIMNYAAAHEFCPKTFKHVCLVEPCRWDHTGVPHIPKSQASPNCTQLLPNMHLVVARWVKPLTKDYGVGFSLFLNAARLATMKGLDAERICKAEVFISHTWQELFQDFTTTLRTQLDPETVVWVCSLGINQHGDIGGALSCIETCPFAVAMLTSHRVLAVTDESAEALERCWVVLEAHLAKKWNKPYDISLPDNSNIKMWEGAHSKLSVLDVKECKASREEDKLAIIDFAQQEGGKDGIDGLNNRVRNIAKEAMITAQIQAAVSRGELVYQGGEIPVDQLTNFRNIRGMSTTHIAASNSRVSAMAKILEKTKNAHLNLEDKDGRPPLVTAIQALALAAVEALIQWKADVHSKLKTGATPLHYAARTGHVEITNRILLAKSDVNAVGTFEGAKEVAPLTVAATNGLTEIIQTLVAFNADVEVRAKNGFSSLHMCAIQGHADAAAALLAAQANVDGGDRDKERTPLMFACSFGNANIVVLLVGAQADPNAKSNDERTVKYYVDKCLGAHPEKYSAVQHAIQWAQDAGGHQGASADTQMFGPLLLHAFKSFDDSRSGQVEQDKFVSAMHDLVDKGMPRVRRQDFFMERKFRKAKSVTEGNPSRVDYYKFFAWICDTARKLKEESAEHGNKQPKAIHRAATTSQVEHSIIGTPSINVSGVPDTVLP